MPLPPRRATSISSDLAAGVVAATPQWHRYPRSWGAAAELIAAGTSPLVEAAFTARLRARVFDSCAPKMFQVLCRTFDIVVSAASASHIAGRPFDLAEVVIPDFADFMHNLQFLQWLVGPHAITIPATATTAEVTTRASDGEGVTNIHTLSFPSVLRDQAGGHIIAHMLCEVIRRNSATLQTVTITGNCTATIRNALLETESFFDALGMCDRLKSLTLPHDCVLPESWYSRLSTLHTLHGLRLTAEGLTFRRLAAYAPLLRDLEVMLGSVGDGSSGDANAFFDVVSRLYRLAVVDDQAWWARENQPVVAHGSLWPESLPLLRDFAWRVPVDGIVNTSPGSLAEIIRRAPCLRTLAAPPAALIAIANPTDNSGRPHAPLDKLRVLRVHGGAVTDEILDMTLRHAPHLRVLDIEATFAGAAALGGPSVGGATATRVQPHARVRRLAINNTNHSTPIIVEDASGSGGLQVCKHIEDMLRTVFPQLRMVAAPFQNRRTQVPVAPLRESV